MNRKFNDQIEYIISQIRSAGYDPYAQLTGFVRTHDDRYITRRGNARNLIMELDLSMIRQYVEQMRP